MRLFAKRVRVVCLRVSVWCCICCVLFAVFVRVVLEVCVVCPWILLWSCQFLRAFVCCYVFACFVYDASCGVVWFGCFCLSLCVWLFVYEIKCVAVVFASCCVMMCDVIWSVYLCFVLCVICCWRCLIVFDCCL